MLSFPLLNKGTPVSTVKPCSPIVTISPDNTSPDVIVSTGDLQDLVVTPKSSKVRGLISHRIRYVTPAAQIQTKNNNPVTSKNEVTDFQRRSVDDDETKSLQPSSTDVAKPSDMVQPSIEQAEANTWQIPGVTVVKECRKQQYRFL